MNRCMFKSFRFLSAVAVLGMFGVATPASAASVSYSTTGLGDLQHQSAYTWQINNINLSGGTVTGATLSFINFRNWTTATADKYNILWVDLLDTAINSANGQIATKTDNTNASTLGLADVLDGFRYSGGTNLSVVGSTGLVTTSTAKTYVGSSTNANDASVLGYNAAGSALGTNAGPFGTTGVNWSLNFAPTAVSALASYIANGSNIAIGLDADCHFYDDSVSLQIFYTPAVTQAAVPEPASMLLLGTGLAAAYARRRRRASAV